MRTPTYALLGILFCLSSGHATPNQIPLTEQTVGASGTGGERTYEIELAKSGFLSLAVTPQSLMLEAKILDPHRHEIRYVPPFKRKTTISLANNEGGKYSLVIKVVPSDKNGSFRFTDVKVWDRATRLNPPSEDVPKSPTLEKLRADFKAKGDPAIRSFLVELKSRGAPILEAIDKDGINKLVTFFWQGDRETSDVVVAIWPFSVFHPDQYQMQQLGHSGLWYKSLRIPKDARFVYSMAVNVPISSSNSARDVLTAAFQEDKLNPLGRSEDPAFFEHDSVFHRVSILEMPDAPPQPWTEANPHFAKGSLDHLKIRSDILGIDHPSAVYLPPNFSQLKEDPSLLIVFDELEYLTYVPTPTILDNLIGAKKIRPTVAILIDFPEPRYDVRARELTCNPQFSRFLAEELLPWAQKTYHVSKDPKRITIAGSSFGGLAATCAGLQQSKTFQNILSQSGSFWWTKEFLDQEFDENAPQLDPDRETNDVVKMFLKEKKLPLHFFMEAGAFEIDLSGHEGYLLLPGEHLRDVLLAKGYDVHWQQFRGGHDYLSWRGSLADGLIYLQGATKN